MQSKTKIATLLLIFGFMFSNTGCSSKETSSNDLNPFHTLQDKETYSLATNDFINLSDIEKSSDKFFDEESSTFLLPENINFTPSYLTDSKLLFGVAYDYKQYSGVYFASYDLNKNEFHKIKRASETTEHAQISIAGGNQNYVVYNEYNPQTQHADTILYDIKENTYNTILSRENVSNMNMMKASFSEAGFILDSLTLSDDDYYYSFTEHELTVLDINTSYNYTFYKGYWYFIKSDISTNTTQLIAYDINDNIQQSLYATSDNESSIKDLCTNNDSLLLIIHKYSLDEYQYDQLYEVNITDKTLNLRYQNDAFNSIHYNNHYLSWWNNNTTNANPHTTYQFFDTTSNRAYEYSESLVIMSNTGLVWIEFIKDPSDINKGEIFRNENIQIRYKDFK